MAKQLTTWNSLPIRQFRLNLIIAPPHSSIGSGLSTSPETMPYHRKMSTSSAHENGCRCSASEVSKTFQVFRGSWFQEYLGYNPCFVSFFWQYIYNSLISCSDHPSAPKNRYLNPFHFIRRIYIQCWVNATKMMIGAVYTSHRTVMGMYVWTFRSWHLLSMLHS